MTARQWEQYYPLTFSALLVGAWTGYDGFWCGGVNLPEKTADLFDSTVNIGVVMAGFLGTALTVLMALQSTAVMTNLRDIGQDKAVIDYFLNAIYYAIAFCVVSAYGVVLDFKDQDARGAFQHFWFSLWLFFGALTLFSGIRILRIFRHVLVSKQQPASPGGG